MNRPKLYSVGSGGGPSSNSAAGQAVPLSPADSTISITSTSPALNSSGGGGTCDGMEERVKRLETDVSDTKKLVTDIRVMLGAIDERTKSLPTMATLLSKLEERTSHMPTYWQAFGILVSAIGLVALIATLVARFLPTAP